MMGVEKVLFPAMRQVGQRPRLSKALYRFSRWGDPFAPERFAWPYPHWAAMAADGPVFYSRANQQWFVSGYDEAQAVLRSPNVSVEAMSKMLLGVSPYTKLSGTVVDNFSNWLLLVDPPRHTRLRGAVSRAFTPRRIGQLQPQVQVVVDRLLADMAPDPNPDVVASFTARLPIYVIGELLGLPSDRHEWLRDASDEIVGLIEVLKVFDPASMNRTFASLSETFTELIVQRRAQPCDDLISALANDPEDRLTNDEIVAMIALLMVAGHETTSGLLGNSVVALAQFPEQRALLRSTPDLIDNAVEELIRWDSPAQSVVRVTTGPVEAGATTIPAGARVELMIGAANRDRRKWSDATELRLDRPKPNPIAFGNGIHHCLGAALARLEMRIAIPAFLAEFGDYTVDPTQVVWKRSHMLRGPTYLPVTR
jgi:cytochrome P450